MEKKFTMKKLSPYTKNSAISYGIVIAGFLAATFMSSTGMMSSSLQGQLVPICAYIVMAVSLNLVVGISGELSIGHAGFMSVGAFSGILTADLLEGMVESDPVRLTSGIIAGGIVAGIAGILIGVPVLRLRGDYLAIVTLAFGEIIKNLMNVIYVAKDSNGIHVSTHGDMELEEDARIMLNGPMGAVGVQRISTFLSGVILVLLTLFIVQNIMNSRQGRAIMACRDNRIAAESIGLNVMQYKLMAFTVSAVLAGMGGALFGLNFSSLLPIKFNFNTSVLILVFVVLGGIGNIWGSVISATVLTVLPEALRQFSDYRMLVYAIVLILVMIFTYNPTLKTYKGMIADKIKAVFRKTPHGPATEGGASE
ncbi:MAG: branched-chain amino acid ABC transporter permease [Eubacterium sp.]|nr:branched-chain amino acid ABC transporter permease [Eubacterium sp.]